jgi:hypothetical protein
MTPIREPHVKREPDASGEPPRVAACPSNVKSVSASCLPFAGHPALVGWLAARHHAGHRHPACHRPGLRPQPMRAQWPGRSPAAPPQAPGHPARPTCEQPPALAFPRVAVSPAAPRGSMPLVARLKTALGILPPPFLDAGYTAPLAVVGPPPRTPRLGGQPWYHFSRLRAEPQPIPLVRHPASKGKRTRRLSRLIASGCQVQRKTPPQARAPPAPHSPFEAE